MDDFAIRGLDDAAVRVYSRTVVGDHDDGAWVVDDFDIRVKDTPLFALYSGSVVEDHDDDAWVIDYFADPGYRRCRCSGHIRTLLGDHNDDPAVRVVDNAAVRVIFGNCGQ